MKKVLLCLLPFWTPLLPPMGIARIKAYLKKRGLTVKTVDATVELRFKKIYADYFNKLKEFIPTNRHANFYNVGHDVLQNHMMAFLNKTDIKEYVELVDHIIYNTYYTHLTEKQFQVIDSIVKEFFVLLEVYIIDLMDEFQPDYFGLTVYSHTLPASLYSFKLVKEKYPNVRTIMGGGIFSEQLAVGSQNYNRFLKQTPYIDKVIIGEGEEIIYKYVSGEEQDVSKVSSFYDTEKGKNYNFSHETPDLNDFQLDHYPYLAAFSSKGCPFQCSFCSQAIFYGKYKRKEVVQAVNEMREMRDIYSNQLFNMIDALLNPLITELSNEFLKFEESIYWEGYLRVGKSVCDTENTMLWRKAGFYRAQMGLESGSQKVLDMMDKKISPELSRSAIASLAYAGIKTTTYWVIGHPGETEEDFQETLDFIEEAKDDIYEAEFHPFQYVNQTGQVQSDNWISSSKTLYPESATDKLLIQTWIVDEEPSRQVIYERLSRFKEHIDRLGIPNPYSINEIYNADERWKKLHLNAVPSLMDFKLSDEYIIENKTIKERTKLNKIVVEEGDFEF